MVNKDNEAKGAEQKPKLGLFKRVFGRQDTSADQAAEAPDIAVDSKSKAEEVALSDGGTPKRSWWARLRDGLARSSGSIGAGLAAIFTKRKLDAEMLEDLEEVLIRADLGITTAARITKAIGRDRYDKDVDVDEVKAVARRRGRTRACPLCEATGNRSREEAIRHSRRWRQWIGQNDHHWQACRAIVSATVTASCSPPAIRFAPPRSSN